jgi:hypothetical protein
MELAGVSLDNVQKLISDYKFFKLSSDEMQNYVLEMGKNGEYISDKQMKFFSEHWPNIQKEYLINMHKNGKTISDKQISVLKYDNKLFYEFLKLSNNERLKNVIDHLSMFKNSVGDGDDGDYYLSPVYVPKYKFYLLTPEQQKIVAEFKQFANVTGIAGLFLAQVLRGVEGEPNLNHLQDSSHFEQNSDNVVILWRPEADFIREIRDPVTDTMIDSRDRVLWRFLKTREGNPQDVLGHCDIQYFRFWHRHHQYGFNYNDLYKDEQFWRNEYGL